LKLSTYAAALAAALPLAGAALAEEPQRGGTLVFAVSAEPPTYDCHAGNTFTIMHHVSPHYSTLLRFDPKRPGEVEGDLAKSWEASADGRTYTFHLHPNIKFHDGTDFSSADVKASYERIINPPAGIISQRKSAFEKVSAIETPDPDTVVFRFKDVDAGIVAQFASPWNCIYSAKRLAADPKFPERNVMGTGAFKFVEHVAGSHWVGERFKDYFLKDRPYLDGFRAVSVSGSAMVNALAGGSVMAEFRGLSPAERDRVVAARGEKIRIISDDKWVQLWRVTFNTERKPFDDPRVRRALNLAVDRWGNSDSIAKVSFMGPVSGFTPPGSYWQLPKEELEKQPGFGRDIKAARAEARRLLKEAGQENLKFTLTNRTLAMPFTPLGLFLIDQWRQIGVTVEHQQLETAAWNNAQNAGNFDAETEAMAEHADDPDILFIRYLSFDRSPINYSRSIDRKVDELYDLQQKTLEKEKRRDVVWQLEKHMMDQAYTLPVFWTNRIVAVAPEVQGWTAMQSHFLGQDLRDVWLKK
jgi:peptide/nickel transport system substrate-binding protein